MKTRNLVVRKRKGDVAGVHRPQTGGILPLPRIVNAFDDSFGRYDLDMFDRTGLYDVSPDVSVAETDKEVKVSACIPGMNEKDISVEVKDNVLSICGEKKEACEDKGKNWHRAEQSYSAFQRMVALPSGIDGAKARAELKKGVLTIALPKTEGERKGHRMIPVKAA
jgi:HSP20 family protein